MSDPATHPLQPSVDLLTAAHEWVWRHSSQPNGDPWDSDPEHLDQTARDLLDDLAEWLIPLEPAVRAPRTHLRVPARKSHWLKRKTVLASTVEKSARKFRTPKNTLRRNAAACAN